MEKKGTPQLSEEEMVNVIQEFKASGLSRRQFCKDHEYPLSNFYYWQKKYYQKFPEEVVQEKVKRGRKAKVQLEGVEGEAIASKPEKVKVAKKKVVKKRKPKKVVSKVPKAVKAVKAELGTEVTPEPKRRGRPKKVEQPVTIDQPVIIAEPKPVRKKSIKKIAEPMVAVPLNQPMIIIRYPNGTRISVSASIDLKRLKELIEL